jgi:hypothetical protein
MQLGYDDPGLDSILSVDGAALERGAKESVAGMARGVSPDDAGMLAGMIVDDMSLPPGGFTTPLVPRSWPAPVSDVPDFVVPGNEVERKDVFCHCVPPPGQPRKPCRGLFIRKEGSADRGKRFYSCPERNFRTRSGGCSFWCLQEDLDKDVSAFNAFGGDEVHNIIHSKLYARDTDRKAALAVLVRFGAADSVAALLAGASASVSTALSVENAEPLSAPSPCPAAAQKAPTPRSGFARTAGSLCVSTRADLLAALFLLSATPEVVDYPRACVQVLERIHFYLRSAPKMQPHAVYVAPCDPDHPIPGTLWVPLRGPAADDIHGDLGNSSAEFFVFDTHDGRLVSVARAALYAMLRESMANVSPAPYAGQDSPLATPLIMPPERYHRYERRCILSLDSLLQSPQRAELDIMITEVEPRLYKAYKAATSFGAQQQEQ